MKDLTGKKIVHLIREGTMSEKKPTKDCLKACIELLEQCLIMLDREETLKREVQKH